MTSSSGAPRLLLVGGGHAMLPALQAARRWVDAGAVVGLLSDCRYLYYSGMVPEYLGGVYTQDEVRIDLEDWCVRAGIPFVEATAETLDPAARVVAASDGTRLPYDLVAFDVGSANPGEPGTAIPTKPLHRIERLSRQIEAALAAPPAPFRLAIVGGGAAGAEVALNVAARFAAAGRAEMLELHLIESSGRLLPGFPPRLATYAARMLRRRGATLHLDATVEAVADGRVQLAGRPPLAADAVLWATGSVGPGLFRAARLPCDGRGFLRVHPTLQCCSDPRILAAGDCAAIEGHEALARIGVHAVKQGPLLRDNLGRLLDALRTGSLPAAGALGRFRPYPVAPLILSTGTDEALFAAGRRWFHGKPFLRLKHLVDRRWMRQYADAWQAPALWDFVAAETPSTHRRSEAADNQPSDLA